MISGAANVVGLLFAYSAFRRGQVAVVAPILSTEGAMAAVIAVVFGEQVGIVPRRCSTAIAAGSSSPRAAARTSRRQPSPAVS